MSRQELDSKFPDANQNDMLTNAVFIYLFGWYHF